MAYQLSTPVRDAQNDRIDNVIGPSARCRIYTGAKPANCAAAPTGTLLLDMALPVSWAGPSAAGVLTKNGVWSAAASANGTVASGAGGGYFRIYDTTGTTCGMQGTVTETGAGGDMTIDNPALVIGQVATVTTFQITAGNP